MRSVGGLLSEPKWMATCCAVGATGLGIAYMNAAGAPLRYPALNAGALIVGIALAGLLTTIRDSGRHGAGLGTLALGAFLLATSLFGVSVNGATRWITFGGLSLQPSLLVIPLMLVRFARSRDSVSLLGLALACVAVALQPDRAMAGTLFVGLLTLATLRRERVVSTALAISLAGFVVTLMQLDMQPAMPFVDQIFFTSFEVHPLAGLAVLGGAVLLIAPVLVGRTTDAEIRHAYVLFGATWLTVSVAAALGNYPTPVVGYGGSAIIGYVLSAFALPAVEAHSVAPWREAQRPTAKDPRDLPGNPITETPGSDRTGLARRVHIG